MIIRFFYFIMAIKSRKNIISCEKLLSLSIHKITKLHDLDTLQWYLHMIMQYTTEGI